MDMVFVRNAIYNYLGNMLSRTAIDALVAGGVTVKRFEARQHLFKEGDPADGMYLIRRGSVTVSRKDEVRGGERILSYVAAGNYVGEMALLRDAPRSATVTATVLTEALVLDAETVRDQLIANPSWRKSVEDQVISRTEQNVILEHTKSRDGDLMQFLLGQGVGEASDVLLINETMCIQCNNCETACAETQRHLAFETCVGPDLRQHPPADRVPPLREPALHEGLPAGRHRPFAARGSVHQRRLHRLRQLRAQLPVWRDPDGGGQTAEARRRLIVAAVRPGASPGERQATMIRRCRRRPSSATCART
jgi:CRP-like cAMP-binding protein